MATALQLRMLLASLLLPFVFSLKVESHASGLENAGRRNNVTSFVKRDGYHLTLNGKPFFILGWNTYHLLDCTHLPQDRQTLLNRGCPATEEVLKKGSSLGLNVLRTWAFHDGAQKHKFPLQVSPGEYDEGTFRMLDHTIYMASVYNVRLILPLVDFVGAYGGALQYLKWAHPRKHFKYEDRSKFYVCKKCRKFFKQHVKMILSRRNTYNNITYRDDPTILAWEVANEPRAPHEPKGDELHRWLEEMTGYVREVDSNHLISIGLEGWFGPSVSHYQRLNPPTVTKYPIDWNATEGSDFIRNHNLSTVDLATFRLWNHWLPDKTDEPQLKRFWKNWIQGHLEAAEHHLNKPVVLEEFGLRDVPTKRRDRLMKLTYNIVEQNINRGGAVAGTCFWMLADDGYPDYDRFTVYHPAHSSTSAVIQGHSTLVRAYRGRSIPELYPAFEGEIPEHSMKALSWETSWALQMMAESLLLFIPVLVTAASIMVFWAAIATAGKLRKV